MGGQQDFDLTAKFRAARRGSMLGLDTTRTVGAERAADGGETVLEPIMWANLHV